jgi:hypothetical protein
MNTEAEARQARREWLQRYHPEWVGNEYNEIDADTQDYDDGVSEAALIEDMEF